VSATLGTMTATIDLDAGPTPAASRRLGVSNVAGFAVAAMVGAAAALASLALPSRAGDAAATPPLLRMSAGGKLPTATVWYADGTHGDASSALSQPWRPDRPVRMVTLAALDACSITVEERLAVTEVAAANRLAVCVWTSPR
jgi:hypothetical protein